MLARFLRTALRPALASSLVLLALGPPAPARAAGEISLTTQGSAYTQDFDTLALSGTSDVVPTGWDFAESRANADTTYRAGTGSSNVGDTYSFGAAGSSERAFGTLQSGTLLSTIGAQFVNNTGQTITSLAISYTGEQWRLGTAGRQDRLRFEVSTDATSLTTGAWAAYPDLDFLTPNTTTTGAKDGNDPANRTALSATLTGLNIPDGTTFWIRWTDFDASGADDGLAVDDFSLTPYSNPTGPISLTTLGSAYPQDFGILGASGVSTVLPTGWEFAESRANANTTYSAGTGSSNVGDTYSFGAAGSSERAFGTLQSGTLLSTLGAQFVNNTGQTITSLAISYTGEQWRLGTAGRQDRLQFELSTGATSLTTGAWGGFAALDFLTPNTTTTGTKDGNDPANRTALSATLSGLSIPDGTTFWIRWTDVDASGADDGLAVDDFSLTPFAIPAGPIPLTALGNPYTQGFDTLATSGNSAAIPSGWAFAESRASADVYYAGGEGTSATGDTYSFGAAGSSERAFGTLQSDTLLPTIGAQFVNNTGQTINALVIGYTGEQWRLGTADRQDRLQFELSTDATSLTTGAWAGYASLDFLTPSTTTTGAKDGNDPANRTALSAALTGLSILDGTTFWVRWTDFDASGADDGLAVDDLSLTPDRAPQVVSILRADPSPTNAASVDFTVTLSEAVSGVDTTDFALTTSGLVGASVSAVTGSGAVYTVSVSTGSGSGTLRLDLIDDDSILDAVLIPLGGTGAGNGDFTSGEVYTIDRDPPSVVSSVRADPSPTSAASVDFTVTFSKPVTGVDASDFTLATSGLVGASISAVSGSDAVYTVSVGTGSGSGTLRLDVIDDDSIVDAALNPLGGPGAGNGDFRAGETYTLDRSGPVVVYGAYTLPANGSVLLTGPTQISVEFNEDVLDDGSAGAVNNPANYLLLEAGANLAFDTLSCAGGPAGDDTLILINSVAYDNGGGAGPFVATLSINGGVPLPPGSYRLLVCGTTSVEDLPGNPLNDGLADARLDFTIGRAASMPATGFAPGRLTRLPAQPAGAAYSALGGLWLEIPSLGVRTAIVGVPLTTHGWDVAWLGQDAGWLNGTAFPTWPGNASITGHVWDAFNRPGPFADLVRLRWGDEVVVHAGGAAHVFLVRSLQTVAPHDTTAITRSEALPWLTLITCRAYDAQIGEYALRVVVRAVLVEVR